MIRREKADLYRMMTLREECAAGILERGLAGDRQPLERMAVDYYPEDQSPDRDRIMEETNRQLALLSAAP